MNMQTGQQLRSKRITKQNQGSINPLSNGQQIPGEATHAHLPASYAFVQHMQQSPTFARAAASSAAI
jgi:hypothetical protein